MTTTETSAPARPTHTVPEETRERVLRGLILHADHADEITPLGHGRYEVPGCSGGSYTVDLDVLSDNPRETCSCPDYLRHKTTCKHIAAATIYRAKSRSVARRVQRPKFSPDTVAANLERVGA